MKNQTKNQNLVLLGLQIKEKRKSKGFTQESLAFEAGIDRSYIGGVERGERNISFLTLVNIARCLSCDISSLSKGIPHEIS